MRRYRSALAVGVAASLLAASALPVEYEFRTSSFLGGTGDEDAVRGTASRAAEVTGAGELDRVRVGMWPAGPDLLYDSHDSRRSGAAPRARAFASCTRRLPGPG